MFQVLIADDEKTVRDSLRESISWKELGLEVAEVASNGYEAVGIVRSRQIDIAVLDIRMPGIDGLRLCGMVKEENPAIQVIIISGYAEFEYARKAIGYGVLGYCLKPLDYSEVTAFLLQAVRKLREKNGAEPRDLLEASMENDTETVAAVLKEYGFPSDSCYVAASAGENAMPLARDQGFSVWLGSGIWGYILRHKFLPQQGEFWVSRQGIRGLGYLEEPVAPGGIYQALEQCSAMAYQYFVNPACKICTKLQEEEANIWLDRVQNCIQGKRWDSLCERLEEIKTAHFEAFTIRSALKLCNMAYMSELFQNSTEDYYVYGIRQLVAQYQSFGNMVDEIYDSVSSAKSMAGGETASGNKSFLKLLQYVNQHYQENITLNSISHALYMNPNYISQLFKKEAGITFIQYITQKRLDDAKELLATTQKSIAEIAMEVGFKDYFYFLRIFKKIVGVSPGKYRMEV